MALNMCAAIENFIYCRRYQYYRLVQLCIYIAVYTVSWAGNLLSRLDYG